jgi:hypothetical protein
VHPHAGGEAASSVLKVKCGWMCLLEALLAPQQAAVGDSLHQDQSQDVLMAGAAAHVSPGVQAGGSGQGNNVGHESAAEVEGAGGDTGAGGGGAAQLKQTILDTLRRL